MIPFVKAHACGNDFLIVNASSVPADKQSDVAIELCKRNTSVGADGVEYFEWTGDRSTRIRLFNSDGSRAEISGNGTRCVAAYMARECGAGPGDTFSIETDAGVRDCRLIAIDGKRFEIAARMGTPLVTEQTVELANWESVRGVVVSMGNPHFVIFVDRPDFTVGRLSWKEVGREICFHPDFPEQTNVEFVRVLDKASIEIRIFERGVGPTTSSGTGTCACAAASIEVGGMASELLVKAQGGTQRVIWAGGPNEMTLIGPAELIATGEAF